MTTLRAERIKRGISQTRLCMLTGIAQSDISAIENGKKYAPPGWRQRLARALQLPIDVLFPEEAAQMNEGGSRS